MMMMHSNGERGGTNLAARNRQLVREVVSSHQREVLQTRELAEERTRGGVSRERERRRRRKGKDGSRDRRRDFPRIEELYFRHVYSRTSSPSIEERVESWKAYCRLFDCVLNEGEREGVGGVGGLVLPNVWLWDMVDEFIYQFQSFCQFRGKLQAKSEEEIERLKELKDEDDDVAKREG